MSDRFELKEKNKLIGSCGLFYVMWFMVVVSFGCIIVIIVMLWGNMFFLYLFCDLVFLIFVIILLLWII